MYDRHMLCGWVVPCSITLLLQELLRAPLLGCLRLLCSRVKAAEMHQSKQIPQVTAILIATPQACPCCLVQLSAHGLDQAVGAPLLTE